MDTVAQAIDFCGGALDDLRPFPSSARRAAGYELDKVQNGRDPSDWKPMNTVGAGVAALFSEEIAVDQQNRSGTCRQTVSRFTEGIGSMSTDSFSSVWDAIEDTPAEAENMKLRSALMMALEEHIRSQGWTQAEPARRLSVTQPRVSDLLRGKIHLFGLDMLVNMVVAAGLHVEMHVAKAA